MIYLYVRHMTTEEYQLKKRIWIHLSPAIFFLISTVTLIQILSPEDRILVFEGNTEVENALPLFTNYVVTSLIIILQVIIYAIRMFKLLRIVLEKCGLNIVRK